MNRQKSDRVIRQSCSAYTSLFPLHSSLFTLPSSSFILHSSLFILHFIKYYYHFLSFPFVASGQKCAMFFRIITRPKNIKNTRPMRLQPCGTAIWAYRLRDRTFVASWLEFNRSGVWYLIVDNKKRIVKSCLLKPWTSTHYELSQISRISNRRILIFKYAKYREMIVRKNISICCLRIHPGHLLMRTKLHGWTMIHFNWCNRTEEVTSSGIILLLVLNKDYHPKCRMNLFLYYVSLKS